jgi:LPS sulfotransferase NodH
VYIPDFPDRNHVIEIRKALACPTWEELQPQTAADVDLSLFVCFTNRSGSNFLTELLHATGELPNGLECFNHPVVVRTARERGLADFAAYCRFRAGRTALARRFVAKVNVDQLLLLARLGYLGTLFPNPRFLHIQRYDVIAQAISFTLAKATQAWSSRQAARVGEKDVAYDAERIERRIEGLTQANLVMRDLLLMNRLDVMPVLYERLVHDPAGEVSRVFEWLGLAPPVLDPSRVRTEKQSSPVKDDWYARYVAERGEGAATSPARRAFQAWAAKR